jgi:peptidoglycan/xylan/chitin deacetylase (PgdA/CDA1 family)
MSPGRHSGGFVISLDFELHWGVRDHRTVNEYRENLQGVREAVPAMLQLFDANGIRATWATVGFLFFQSLDELRASLPTELPSYRDAWLDPYAALSEVGANEDEDPFHFAPSLIQKITATEGQEVGTHTLSHFYTLAEGPTIESFRADIKSAKLVALRHGIKISSIVFPRNQVSRPHLRICAEEGIVAYRSTEADPWIEKGSGILGRALRFADSYVAMSGDGCTTPSLDEEFPIVRISGSRFLRPWNPALAVLEEARLHRICASMNAAAKESKIFHLWWHPHNFGRHLEQNMAFLRRIIEHYARLNAETGWPSLTMAEVAGSILRAESPHCVA